MTSKLPAFIKGLGFFDGIKLYNHVKFKRESPVQFSFLKHPLYLRNIKSDLRIFEQIFMYKEYNIEFPFRPEVIIDLGANVGYASVLFANRFPQAKIIAVEPEDDNFIIAQKNVQSYKNISVIKGAVWNKS